MIPINTTNYASVKFAGREKQGSVVHKKSVLVSMPTRFV